MASPDLADFERTAREIVRTAMLEGTLSNLTVRKVRAKIETLHELENGFLLTPPYRHSLKAVIQDASAQARREMKNEEARCQPGHAPDNVNDTPKGQQAGKYKSAEFVEDSSDLEELSENNLTRVSPKTKFSKEPRAPPKSPLKKRRTELKTKDSDESDEMASLLDDSPKPKKKARTSGDESRVKKMNSNKSKSSDKHDATIKKLKSLVLACGVRKPWVKVFKDMPKPTQQIKKLREILTELGMTGRMGMEQAKRIKAERAMAQELEDVKSFEQSMLNSSRRRIAESSSRPSVKPIDPADEDSEDDVDLRHKRRKIPVSRSIDAFIGSESGDD